MDVETDTGGNVMDPVNHPQHYTFSQIEVIDAIEAWKLGYHLGNVIKYVARAQHKGKYLEDLKKAQWYLQREIERVENP
jgi:hypothetical protein